MKSRACEDGETPLTSLFSWSKTVYPALIPLKLPVAFPLRTGIDAFPFVCYFFFMSRRNKFRNLILLERWINLAPAEVLIEAVDFPSSIRHRKIEGRRTGDDLIKVKSVAVRGMSGTFLLLSAQDREEAFKNTGNNKKGNFESFCQKYTIPGEKLFDDARELLKKDQRRHEFFFSWALDNKYLNQKILNEIFYGHQGCMGIVVNGLHAAPGSLATPFTMTIQDYIEIEFILKPAFNLSDTTFEMLRRCPICKQLFCAKNSLATFCSSKCRGIAFRNKKKQ